MIIMPAEKTSISSPSKQQSVSPKGTLVVLDNNFIRKQLGKDNLDDEETVKAVAATTTTQTTSKSSKYAITSKVEKTLKEAAQELVNDVIAQGQNISRIGVVDEFLSLRKLDISFNLLTSLQGIGQLNSLRHLAAYSCRLNNVEDLASLTHIETLMLQQNSITEIIFGFEGFKKLRELRLDRNQLTTIDHLQHCSSLRVLDLSWNKITSLEGLAGLQSLQELKINNNLISSLLPLRALPSLVEIQVSNNRLKTLDGIQQIPTLQTIHAECNQLTTLQIPQTYTHQEKLPEMSAGPVEKSAVATTSKSSKLSTNKVGSGKGNSSKPSSAASTSNHLDNNANNKTTKGDKVQVLGMPALAEIFLSGNHITSLQGLDSLGLVIELLDVRENRISNLADDVTAHVEAMGGLKLLTIFRIAGNPVSVDKGYGEDDVDMHVFARKMVSLCPLLESLDNMRVVRHGVSSDPNQQEFQLRDEREFFHTWNDDASTVKDVTMEDKDEFDIVADLQPSDDAEIADTYNKKHAVPTIHLKDMKTMEEIQAMEKEFTSILHSCKDTLKHVFMLPVDRDLDVSQLALFQNKKIKSALRSNKTDNNKDQGNSPTKAKKKAPMVVTFNSEADRHAAEQQPTQAVQTSGTFTAKVVSFSGGSPSILSGAGDDDKSVGSSMSAAQVAAIKRLQMQKRQQQAYLHTALSPRALLANTAAETTAVAALRQTTGEDEDEALKYLRSQGKSKPLIPQLWELSRDGGIGSLAQQQQQQQAKKQVETEPVNLSPSPPSMPHSSRSVGSELSSRGTSRGDEDVQEKQRLLGLLASQLAKNGGTRAIGFDVREARAANASLSARASVGQGNEAEVDVGKGLDKSHSAPNVRSVLMEVAANRAIMEDDDVSDEEEEDEGVYSYRAESKESSPRLLFPTGLHIDPEANGRVLR